MSQHARRWAQSRKRLRSMAAALVLALLALVSPIVTGFGAASASAAVTVTGTASGDHAWNPATGQQFADAPQVTVDQTENLTDQVVHVSWKNFTPSSDRQGAPQTVFVPNLTAYSVTVLECRGTDPGNLYYVSNYFGEDCYGFVPANPNASSGVGNQVMTFTGPDGSGEAYLHIETAVENSFLGCDASHPCSIMVLPNWGGVQPDYAPPGDPTVKCADHSSDLSGLSGDGQWAMDAALGDACSWSDRIVVPLHFAPTPTDCPSKKFSFASQGAPLLARAMAQWQSGWCTGIGSVNFDYDSGTNEYQARQSFLAGGSGSLTSAADVVLTNQPADASAVSTRKYTYAPIANTGIGIAFHIDDPKTGKLIPDINLDARLVAKLLTQSYALFQYSCTADPSATKQGPSCDPATKGNPISIVQDPEFLSLNPQLSASDFPANADGYAAVGGFLPLVVSGNSDMTHELTRWIASDPDATAFLAGQPDHWGMHVNTYYRGVRYPVDQFQVMDPGYSDPKQPPGYGTTQVSWNPLSGMANVVTSLVTDRPSGQNNTPTCVTQSDGTEGNCVYSRLSSVQLGQRAMFGVVGLDDAAASEFPVAHLINSAGQAVAPTTAALAAGVRDMTVSANKITAVADDNTSDPKAYPLTMTEYAMVPTCGVNQTTASGITSFLNHVVNSQVYGTDPGTLAPGNLTLTDAQSAQTQVAAQAVSSTPCNPTTTGGSSPPKPGSGAGNPGTSNNGSGSGGGPSNSGSASGGGSNASSTGPDSTSNPATSGGNSAAPKSPSPLQATPQAYGIKHSDGSNPINGVLPLLLIAAALLLIAGPALYLVSLGGTRTAAASLVARVLRR